MFKKKFLNAVYLIFLGVISAFSLPPYNYFIINFVTFTLLFIFIFNKKKVISSNRFFFKYGWFFGFGYFLSSLYWISISLTFDQTFKFLIPFAIILVPGFLAIFYGLITYLFSVFYSKKVIISFLVFSILFGTIELLRGFIFTGFPWNLIAFSFSKNLNFIQILSIIGLGGAFSPINKHTSEKGKFIHNIWNIQHMRNSISPTKSLTFNYIIINI